MDSATATARLQRMLDYASDPVLSSDEITDLLAFAARPDAAGNDPRNASSATAWASATSYEVNDHIRPNPADGRYWRCVVAGVSGTTQPSWPDLGGLARTTHRIIDGDVVWEDAGGPWQGTYDLNAAAAEGWRWKAGKCAGRFGFTTDGQSFQRQQVHAHCLEQAAVYQRRVNGSAPTGGR